MSIQNIQGCVCFQSRNFKKAHKIVSIDSIHKIHRLYIKHSTHSDSHWPRKKEGQTEKTTTVTATRIQ